MTEREAAIVSAYTGYLIGSFSEMHKYCEGILERPIFTHEFASKSVMDEIHEKSKEDFCKIEIDSHEPLLYSILDETTRFCEECPSRECCPEDECVLFRIEKLAENELR